MAIRLATSSKIRVVGVKDGSCSIRVEANKACCRRGEGNPRNVPEGSILDGWERVISGHEHGHLVVGRCSSDKGDSFVGISRTIFISCSLSLGWGNRHSEILGEVRDGGVLRNGVENVVKLWGVPVPETVFWHSAT